MSPPPSNVKCPKCRGTGRHDEVEFYCALCGGCGIVSDLTAELHHAREKINELMVALAPFARIADDKWIRDMENSDGLDMSASYSNNSDIKVGDLRRARFAMR